VAVDSASLAGAHTGLRLGELCGWQLGDLHLAERRADVKRSLGQECSMRNPQPSTTKTDRQRRVDLSADLAAVLGTIQRERKAKALARNWHPIPPWVFVTGNGSPYSERNVSRDFKRVLEKAKLPDHLTVHSLRHSFATLHLTAGADLQWVQQQLGHVKISMTADTYGAWIKKRDLAAADRLALAVNAAVNGA
jgi:integrase